MKPSWKHQEERPFFDVRVREKAVGWRRFFGWFGRHEAVNLRPNFVRRNRHVVVTASILFVVGIFIGNRVLTRAEALDLHPATCLGTWQNVQFAAGAPENFNSAVAVGGFGEDNSAVYKAGDSPSHISPSETWEGKQIYCGGFLSPEAETKGNLTSAALTFVWHVGELEDRPVEMTVSENTPSSSGAEFVPIEAREAPSTDVLETEPTEDVEVPQSRRPTEQFLSFVLPRVYAQDAPSEQAPPPAEVSAPPEPAPSEPAPAVEAAPAVDEPVEAEAQNVPPAATQNAEPEPAPPTEIDEATSTPVIILPPLRAELEEQASSTPAEILPEEAVSSTIATTAVLAPPPVPPDDTFLRVTYSLDGTNWVELARVSEDSWQNFTVALPVTSWTELKQLQIAVEGISTTIDPIPPVYLAGMFVEAKYELQPLFGDEPREEELSLEDVEFVEVDGNLLRPADGSDGSFAANQSPVFDFDLSALAPTSSAGVAPTATIDVVSAPLSTDVNGEPPEPVPVDEAPPPPPEPAPTGTAPQESASSTETSSAPTETSPITPTTTEPDAPPVTDAPSSSVPF